MSLRKTMLMLLVSLCAYTTVTAQQSAQAKPKLFAAYPSSFSISINTLEKIFGYMGNQEAVIDFGNNLVLPSKIIANQQKYSNLQTVIIRSSAFDNAMIQVTKTIAKDASITYSGRIINEKSADGFQIKKSSAGLYTMEKFETDKVLEGCF